LFWACWDLWTHVRWMELNRNTCRLSHNSILSLTRKASPDPTNKTISIVQTPLILSNIVKREQEYQNRSSGLHRHKNSVK
jgi:hypothetical protein